MDRRIAFGAIVVALLFAACSGSDGNDTPAPTSTAVAPFTEVIEIEKSALTLAATTHGTCDQHASQRHDVWRCFVEPLPDGGNIVDYCISASPADAFVLCATDWFGGADAIRVDLDAPLPARTDDEGFTAMALELDDGTRCSFIGGATFVVGDERANFHCTDDSWLIGNPMLGDDGAWSWPQCREECSGESPPEEPLGVARAARVWG